MNIESIKRRLLVKYPFFGGIVARVKFISESSISTAGTDGETIYYNPSFVESLTSDQQVFLFAHEVCHIAFDHIYRSEDRDKKIWNIATDSVINAFLKKDNLPIIEGGIDIPDAINYDAEEMYEKLIKEKEKQQQQGNSDDSSESESNKNSDVGHDTHGMWAEAVEKKKEQNENSNSDNDQIQEKNDKSDDIERISELGEKRAFKENKIERSKQLEELRQSLASQSYGHGDGSNSAMRDIVGIGESKPLIDWRKLLKESTTYDVDWSYQRSELRNGVIVPTLQKKPMSETEIVLDTSGSIDVELLKNFLRECKNILQTSKIKVGCFDTKFYGFSEIRTVSDIDKLKFEGGGGTDFNAAVNAFTSRVENKIIFTDGCAFMPQTPMDAIWVVFGSAKINPPGGKVIYINEEQLMKLQNYEIKKGRTM